MVAYTDPLQQYLVEDAIRRRNQGAGLDPLLLNLMRNQMQQQEPGSGRGGTGPSPGGYGTRSESEKSISNAIGTLGAWGGKVADVASGLFGVSTPASGMLGMLGMGPRAANFTEGLLQALGMTPSMGYYGLSPQDLQGIRDYAGYFAEQEAKIADMQNLSIDADMRNSLANAAAANARAAGEWGNYGKAIGDWGEPTPSGEIGGGWGNASPGVSSDPDSTSSGFGTSDSAGPSTFARGGVGYFNRPTRPLVGEAGPEMGIFIKPEMFQPGIQGNEDQVRLALLRAILGLSGGRNATR